MRKAADHDKMRQTLLRAAVCAVAEYGMEGATSKKTALLSGLNESYIFRYYLDLKDLREKAFYYVLETWLEQSKLKKDKSEREVLSEFYDYLYLHKEEVFFFTRYVTSAEMTEEKIAFTDNVIRNVQNPVCLFAMQLGNFACLSSLAMSVLQGITPRGDELKTAIPSCFVK